MINTIIFDMGNVLIEWNPTRFIQEMEHDPARQEKIVQASLLQVYGKNKMTAA